MNTALFKERMKDLVEELVLDWKVPRSDVENLVRYLSNGCIAAEAEAQNDAQFLLDFRRLKSAGMASLHGKSEQAMRKRRNKLLSRNPELRAQLRDQA
jgi:hypothetical protein